MKRMTNEQAIHILMHLEEYVEHDEYFGNMIRAPLMDASVMAIKALKENEELNRKLEYAYAIIGRMIDG